MLKKTLFILFITVLIASCTSNGKKTESQELEISKLVIDDFDTQAAKLVGKSVEITAIVNHVCQHGGKRMFLVAEGSEESVKVIPGENMAAFNTDLEGAEVKVNGIIEELRIDEAYLVEWESELIAEVEHEKSEAEHDGEEHGDGHDGGKGEDADMGQHQEAEKSIADFRTQIAESGTDHLSFYTIVADKYEVLKQAEKVVEEEISESPE